MKNILVLSFLAMLSVNSFAKTCVVASADKGTNNFNNEIATYTNIENSEHTIMTVIKPNGETLLDIDIDTFYDGLYTQRQIDSRTEELIGSKITMISSDKTSNQLTLTIGYGSKDKIEMIKTNAMSISDLSSSKSAVFDMKNGLTVYCVDQ